MPLPFSLVVKNGSKTRARVSGSMPRPVSLTRQAHVGAGTQAGMEAGEGRVDVDVAGFQGQGPSLGHGVARVHREIQHDLAHLSEVGPYPGQGGVRPDPLLDALLDEAGQHLGHLCQHLVQVDDLRLQVLAPAEGQELASEVRGVLGRLADHAHVVELRAAFGEAAPQQLGRPGHHHQEVVEVVSDASGQAPDRLHLQGLPQLVFQRALLGDVLGREVAGGSLRAECRAWAAPAAGP